jgi:hypothetical protein
MKKRFLVLGKMVCFLLCVSLTTACAAQTSGDILHFTEEEFFNADRSVLGARESDLLDMDFSGVAVFAPRRISTAHRKTLPLIMATGLSGERDWDVPLAKNCILVGSNLQDGTVRFANALVSEKEMRSRGVKEKALRGPKPDGLPLTTAQLTALDARRRLHIPWNVGTWALGVIYHDWPSNTVVVELEGDQQVKPPAARAVDPQPSPLGVGGLPCYLATPWTPPPPQSGVAFTTQFGVEQGRQQLKVFGAFRVPVRGFHVVGEKVVHEFQDGRQENVTAVIPVTLALLGLDWMEPLQFDWAVPIYGQQPVKPGAAVRGCFALNALAGADVIPLSAGKFICYIIMDGRIFGPQAFEIQEIR